MNKEKFFFVLFLVVILSFGSCSAGMIDSKEDPAVLLAEANVDEQETCQAEGEMAFLTDGIDTSILAAVPIKANIGKVRIDVGNIHVNETSMLPIRVKAVNGKVYNGYVDHEGNIICLGEKGGWP